MKKLTLLIAFLILSLTLKAQDWEQVSKIEISDGDPSSVAIEQDYAILGASTADTDISSGNTLTDAGAAYIFKNNSGTWSEVQKIIASDIKAGDNFGCSVSISGNYAIIGANGGDFSSGGAAYIFKNNAGNWTEIQKITASDIDVYDQFGWSVSISGDYAVIGAYNEDGGGFSSGSGKGAAYIFKNNAGNWTETQKITASDIDVNDQFGWSVSISDDYVIIGANNEGNSGPGMGRTTGNGKGSAYIFKNNSGTWTEVQKITASDGVTGDNFGHSVSISGNYIIIIGHFRGSYIFKNNAGNWTEIVKLNTPVGVSASISGDNAIVGYHLDTPSGMAFLGAAYVFNKNKGGTDNWEQVQKVTPNNRLVEGFGGGLGMSNNHVIIYGNVSFGSSSTYAYIFENIPKSEINIKQGITDIVSGSEYSFNNIEVNSSTEVEFTIESIGVNDLNLTGAAGNLVVLEGSDANQFSINQSNVTSTIAPNDSKTFTVKFSPTSGGVKNATLTITSNDPDEGTYVINLKGVGNNPYNLDVKSSGPNSVELEWTDELNDETGFRIFRQAGLSGVMETIATVSANATTYTDQTAEYLVGVTYFYRVQAIGSVDNSFSNMRGAVPNPDDITTPTLINENSEPYNYQGLWVYPNPSAGLFKVFLPAGTERAKITISNAQGQVILERESSPNAEEIELDLSAYVAGQYYLQVERNGQVLTKTLVKE